MGPDALDLYPLVLNSSEWMFQYDKFTALKGLVMSHVVEDPDSLICTHFAIDSDLRNMKENMAERNIRLTRDPVKSRPGSPHETNSSSTAA